MLLCISSLQVLPMSEYPRNHYLTTSILVEFYHGESFSLFSSSYLLGMISLRLKVAFVRRQPKPFLLYAVVQSSIAAILPPRMFDTSFSAYLFFPKSTACLLNVSYFVVYGEFIAFSNSKIWTDFFMDLLFDIFSDYSISNHGILEVLSL